MYDGVLGSPKNTHSYARPPWNRGVYNYSSLEVIRGIHEPPPVRRLLVPFGAFPTFQGLNQSRLTFLESLFLREPYEASHVHLVLHVLANLSCPAVTWTWVPGVRGILVLVKYFNSRRSVGRRKISECGTSQVGSIPSN